ncbi:MAG: hypothetical protein PSV35_05990, partial [bacterium]|nr:hypothetical protein [bacterium]
GYQYSTKSTLTGTRIGDGMTVIHGIVIQISPADQLIEGYTPQRVEIKNGSLYMDNKEIEAHENVVTLPANVLKELKAKLNISTDTEAQDEIIIDEHAKRPLIELTEKVSISL